MKVVDLRTGKGVSSLGEPDANVVAALEGYLAQARAGNIKGFVIVTEHVDPAQSGNSLHGWFSTLGLGHLTALTNRIASNINDLGK